MGFNKDFKVLVYKRRGNGGKGKRFSNTKPLLDARQGGGVFKRSARFQPSQPGLTKAGGIAGNEAKALATHGLSRDLGSVKPTGASGRVCAKAGGAGRLQPFTGAASWAHIWRNPRRRRGASPGSWKGRARWREAGRQRKRRQMADGAAEEEEKGFGNGG